MRTIDFSLNGKKVICEVHESELLLHTLRERLSIKSVKEGCSIGECGTCTVLIDDEPHYSCLTLASKVDGRDVKTVEFLGDAGMLHPLQEAFIKYGAVQCGYCTPGMLLSAYSLLLKKKNPDKALIKEAISGNLCRCTGYIQIEEAIEQASLAVQSSKFKVQGSELDNPQGHDKNNIKGNPQSKEELLGLLFELEEAKIIAGGTDLLVSMRKGNSAKKIIDIMGTPELAGISENEGLLTIGAAETHARISTNTLVRNHAKSLSLACGWVGSPQIRNMGTIGGNLVNASPAADSIPPFLIHDAMLTVESKKSERNVRLEDFIIEPYKTSIKKDELLTSISIKGLSGHREGYRRVTKRATWAISRLSVAWAILEEENTYRDVRLAIGSCTPMPFRASKVETFLKGQKKEKAVVVESVEMILREITEVTGMRPSFVYKLPVLKGILESALRGQ